MERNLQLFKALADGTRLRLLHLLAHRGPEICVCDMVEVLQMPQSTISRQMAPLRMLGLVQARRVGTWMLYSLAPAADAFGKHLLRALENSSEPGDELADDVGRFDALMRKKALACCGSAMAEATAGRRG